MVRTPCVPTVPHSLRVGDAHSPQGPIPWLGPLPAASHTAIPTDMGWLPQPASPPPLGEGPIRPHSHSSAPGWRTPLPHDEQSDRPPRSHPRRPHSRTPLAAPCRPAGLSPLRAAPSARPGPSWAGPGRGAGPAFFFALPRGFRPRRRAVPALRSAPTCGPCARRPRCRCWPGWPCW